MVGGAGLERGGSPWDKSGGRASDLGGAGPGGARALQGRWIGAAVGLRGSGPLIKARSPGRPAPPAAPACRAGPPRRPTAPACRASLPSLPAAPTQRALVDPGRLPADPGPGRSGRRRAPGVATKCRSTGPRSGPYTLAPKGRPGASRTCVGRVRARRPTLFPPPANPFRRPPDGLLGPSEPVDRGPSDVARRAAGAALKRPEACSTSRAGRPPSAT
jgi:hypothetical protein